MFRLQFWSEGRSARRAPPGICGNNIAVIASFASFQIASSSRPNAGVFLQIINQSNSIDNRYRVPLRGLRGPRSSQQFRILRPRLHRRKQRRSKHTPPPVISPTYVKSPGREILDASWELRQTLLFVCNCAV